MPRLALSRESEAVVGMSVMSASALQARLREWAEPVKRRVRGRGRDPLSQARRARDIEPDPTVDVDVVIAWVDDNDPLWRQLRLDAVRAATLDPLARFSAADARFRSLDELRYALRGVDRNMPWVRAVVLVTSGQPLPPWLDPCSVRVVTHPEFMDADALPTFNSHAIEAALWRIDGLAEHFVYLNDDFLVVRGRRPNDFFSPGWRPRVVLTGRSVPCGPPEVGEPYAGIVARNARDLLARAGVGTATRLIAHTPVPQRRSIHAELAERFGDVLAATERARLRTSNDVPPVFLHTWYALLTGRAEEVAVTSRYVELSEPGGPARLAVEARRRDVDYLCPNLAADPAMPWPQLAAEVRAALEAALPGRSRFELAEA